MEDKKMYIWLYEVKYITWGMDRPAAAYFYYPENAQKYYEELTAGETYRADPPNRVSVKMDFVCYTRPDAIRDADDAVNAILMRYALSKEGV